MDPVDELALLVRARHPLLAVETCEEERLEAALGEVARRLGLGLFLWSVTGGLRRPGRDHKLYDSQDPRRALDNLPTLVPEGIVLLQDVQHWLREPDIVRRLKDLAVLRPGQRRTIVLSGADLDLPPDLDKACARFRLALPDAADLLRLLQQVLSDLSRLHPIRVDLRDADRRRLLEGLRGLTQAEAERALTRAVLDDLALTAADVEAVQRAKRDLLAKDGVLEYVPRREGEDALGGLASLKAWLATRAGAFTAEAVAFGLPPPRGIVLLGVQGCGKTAAARLVANTWDLPLLRFEPGRLYEKYVGESEKRLERALALAEHMAPCVLLVDEIEKGFAAAGGADVDGGLSLRILGRLLGWLQDRTAAVFVVATSNRVTDLPPEMLRKGRFDEIFFVDLPDAAERREILALHLARRRRDPACFDLDLLARLSEGFSGAEIEQAVVSGLYAAFGRRGRAPAAESAPPASAALEPPVPDLDTQTLAAEIRATRPLSAIRREDVAALRAWAADRAVPAR